MKRNRLYILLLLASATGIGWLLFNLLSGPNETVVCLFKRTTGLPCPSCGATRSMECLLNGDLKNALYINPVGIILTVIMFLTPAWILIDLIRRRNTFFNFYNRFEFFLRKPGVMIPFIALVFVNWIWNITKGL